MSCVSCLKKSKTHTIIISSRMFNRDKKLVGTLEVERFLQSKLLIPISLNLLILRTVMIIIGDWNLFFAMYEVWLKDQVWFWIMRSKSRAEIPNRDSVSNYSTKRNQIEILRKEQVSLCLIYLYCNHLVRPSLRWLWGEIINSLASTCTFFLFVSS